MPESKLPEPTYENLHQEIDKLGKQDQLRLFQDLMPEDLRRKLLGYHWSLKDRRNFGLIIKVPICIQDPAFSPDKAELRFDEIEVSWDPGLTTGPKSFNSARLTVDDYSFETDSRTDPAQWDEKLRLLPGPGETADRDSRFRD